MSASQNTTVCYASRIFSEFQQTIISKHAPVATKYRPKANNHAVIEQSLEYIRQNLTAELTLETLAAAANFSPIYFHKLFKASTGQTLNDYITEQRIKKSVMLLLSTDMTLTRIAYECGFSSQSYFSYAFKKRMKLPCIGRQALYR